MIEENDSLQESIAFFKHDHMLNYIIDILIGFVNIFIMVYEHCECNVLNIIKDNLIRLLE